MTQIIIFSKNRAMMLDALLRSILKCMIENYQINVICKMTNPSFHYAYNLCKNEFWGKDIKFYFEDSMDNFKKVLMGHRSAYHNQVAFMVDDDIVFKQFKYPVLKPFETYSLRLHSGIQNPVHFSYTMSVDGNVFRWEDIYPLLGQIEFNNPNDLEKRLQGGFGSKFTQKYGEGHLIGFNHTRVSEGSKCSFTGIYTDEELNARYIGGERIDFEKMNITRTGDVHTSKEYKFLKK